MKIGVTGATGQLGRMVVDKLKEKVSANSVVALVRNPEKAAGMGVEVRSFDYNQSENLALSLQGIDKLLLISSNEFSLSSDKIRTLVDTRSPDIFELVSTLTKIKPSSSNLLIDPTQYVLPDRRSGQCKRTVDSLRYF